MMTVGRKMFLLWRGFSGVFALSLLILMASLTAVKAAHAFDTELEEDLVLDCSISLRWGGAWRLNDPDDELLADPNTDDGNRNFGKGDMVKNQFSSVIDTDLRYKKMGLFFRPRAYYDFAYEDGNANDSPETNNNGPLYGGALEDNNDFPGKTKDQHRDKVEVLDAFAYGTFDLGGRDLVLRIGRQVVSWGESLFILNSISSAQSPVDATQLNAPGVELRDIFLPTGQAYAQADLWKGLTLAGFYQWEWGKNRLDEAGSYFSTDDYLFEAGRHYLVPVALDAGLAATVDHVSDEEARDDGQWGMALRYNAEWLNDTEFGLYYINYHEKMPMLNGSFTGGNMSMDWTALFPGTDGELLNLIDGSSYWLSYAEDVKLLGVSAGGMIGDTNVSGEVSFRENYPVAVEDLTNIMEFSYRDAEVLQAQVSFVHLCSPLFSPFWDNTILMGEIGWNRVYGIDDEKLIYDRSAWGGTIEVDLEYYNFLLPALNLTVPLIYEFYPDGVSSAPGTFTEDADKFGINFNFLYLGIYEFGVGYTAFLNDPDENPLADRDYLSVFFKYTF